MEGQAASVSTQIMLSPPLVFLVVMGATMCFALLLSRLSLKITKLPVGMTKAYSCGEELPTHLIQPDYSQFYPFAFYFTILHVVALMAATVPVASLETSLIAVVYILGAIIGLFVLYKD